MIGLVSLVGAGPGDPELITVRGLNRLRAADVVVYDRLIHPDLLSEVRDGAERIYVGKAAGFSAVSQSGIEQILVERGRAGRRVVRLKGGDPFVFGRGAEEIEALSRAGVPWEIVPGVTSAVAAPAAAGIPVTHRGHASHVTIVTGHEDPSKDEPAVDWTWLARGSGTLVILMGLELLEEHCRRLMAEGLNPDTPAAVVASGTLPEQTTVVSTLADLADEVRHAGVRSPAAVVVGAVAAFPAVLAAYAGNALAAAV
jgi:uroporphyrin-III C-methyltransferase